MILNSLLYHDDLEETSLYTKIIYWLWTSCVLWKLLKSLCGGWWWVRKSLGRTKYEAFGTRTIWQIRNTNRFVIYVKLGHPERCHNHCFTFNCFWLHYHFYYWDRLQLTRKVRWSSIWEKSRSPLIFKKIVFVFHFLLVGLNKVTYQKSTS